MKSSAAASDAIIASATMSMTMTMRGKSAHVPTLSILLVISGIIQQFSSTTGSNIITVAAFSSPPPLPIPILLTSPPILGLGSLLFKPRNVKIVKSSNYQDYYSDDDDDNNDILAKAGSFFVDAFWAGKIGGASTLSVTQANTLERQQIQEFKKRYNNKNNTNNKSSFSRSGSGSGAGAGSIGSSNRLPGRYADKQSPLDSRAELVLCLNDRGECLGCAGVEGEFLVMLAGP